MIATSGKAGKVLQVSYLRHFQPQDNCFINAILGRHEVKVPDSFALKVVKFTEVMNQQKERSI